MRDGVAHRAEAVVHGAYELLGRDRIYGVEDPVARPVVVVDEEAAIVIGHRVQFRASRSFNSTDLACDEYHGRRFLADAHLPLNAFD